MGQDIPYPVLFYIAKINDLTTRYLFLPNLNIPYPVNPPPPLNILYHVNILTYYPVARK